MYGENDLALRFIAFGIQWALGIVEVILACFLSIRLAGGMNFGSAISALLKVLLITFLLSLPALLWIPTLFSLGIGSIYFWPMYGGTLFLMIWIAFQSDWKEAWTIALIHWPIAVLFAILVYHPIYNRIYEALDKPQKRVALVQPAASGSFSTFSTNPVTLLTET